MKTYKFLAAGARSPFAGHPWPMPTDGEPGSWVESGAPLEQCVRGIHVCRPQDLPLWLDAELWEVEVGGESLVEERQLLVERARLVRRLERWGEETASELGLDCMRTAQAAAAGALRAAGLAAEADRLDAADAPDDVRETAHAASAVAGEAGHAVACRVAYAAGSAANHMAIAPRSSPSYVSHAAFSAYAATVVADTLEPGGYDAERARQAAWISGRLDLA